MHNSLFILPALSTYFPLIHQRRNAECFSLRCCVYSHNLRCTYLEHSEKSLGKVVKGTPLGLGFIKVELSTKHLHAQQGEDNDEQEEQQQQGSDGLHGVEQRCHQVA